MNSTHEAIAALVPMISYPFFWDQLALAEWCQRFGLAVPLTVSPLARVHEKDVNLALALLPRGESSVREQLLRARAWELEVIANRASVVERIMALVRAHKNDPAAVAMGAEPGSWHPLTQTARYTETSCLGPRL